jgi:bifunctional non-homologous end joining protein LigD
MLGSTRRPVVGTPPIDGGPFFACGGPSKLIADQRLSFEPMLCQSTELPPEGPDWRYELKLDGFRAIGRKSGRSAQLWSRNQKDFSRRFPTVLKGIAELLRRCSMN